MHASRLDHRHRGPHPDGSGCADGRDGRVGVGNERSPGNSSSHYHPPLGCSRLLKDMEAIQPASVEPRRRLHPRARRPGRAARSRRAQARAEPEVQPENLRVPVRAGCRVPAGWEHVGLTQSNDTCAIRVT